MPLHVYLPIATPAPIANNIIRDLQVVGVSPTLEASPAIYGQIAGVGLDLPLSLTLQIFSVIIRPPLQ